MLTYLEKFNNLPKNIRQQISTIEVMQAIKEIGKRYQLDLATVVMRVMVKEIDIRQLSNFFVDHHNFDQARAQHLENELKEKVFADVINYLYRKPVIKQQTSQDGVPLTTREDDYLRNKIKKVMAKSNLSLGSTDLEKRAQNILFTYLKEVRDKLATLDALTRPFESGGLGLDKQSATNLIAMVDSQRQVDQELEVHSPARIPVPEDQIYSRDTDYDLVKELAKRQTNNEPVVQPKTDNKPVTQPEIDNKSLTSTKNPLTKLAPPPPATVLVDDKTVASGDQAKPLVKEVADPDLDASKVAVQTKKQPAQKAKQPIDKLRKTEGGKIKMDDIQSAPKVFTPVDELRYMTLKNFRNLDKDPWQAIEKVKAKLRVLKKEDYGKMVAGIKGWKKSPVNNLYLSVYQSGLNQGKSASDILHEKLEQDANFLTENEFEAIIKLNQELKF